MDMFDTVAASEKGAFLHLVSPAKDAPAYAQTPEGKDDLNRPIRIKLVGRDSAAFRDNVRARSTKMIKQRAGKMDFKKMTEDQITNFLLEQEESAVDDAADATVSWENISIDGQLLDCNHANAMKVYAAYPEVLRQVQEFTGNMANFFSQD